MRDGVFPLPRCYIACSLTLQNHSYFSRGVPSCAPRPHVDAVRHTVTGLTGRSRIASALSPKHGPAEYLPGVISPYLHGATVLAASGGVQTRSRTVGPRIPNRESECDGALGRRPQHSLRVTAGPPTSVIRLQPCKRLRPRPRPIHRSLSELCDSFISQKPPAQRQSPLQ